MAYDTKGLYAIANNSRLQIWGLDTVDAIVTSAAAGYITDAITAALGKGVAGKGMRIGDTVLLRVVDNVQTPTSVSDEGWYYVSALNTTTGAATLTAHGAT